MQRSINWKLLLWTLAGLLVAALAVHGVHLVQIQRNVKSLLSHAERAREAGQFDQALTYFTHYLAYEPDDTAALAEYGLTMEKQATGPADRLRVVVTFEKVVQREPGRKDIRHRLIHLLIQLHRFKEASTHVQALLPQWDNQAELEHILGWCQEATGEYAKAVASFGRAIEKDPRRQESYILLAEVLGQRLDQAEEAGKVMDRLVAANGESFGAYLSRFRFHRQQDALAQAEADLNKALALAPKEPAVLLAAAEWAQGKGDLVRARELVQRGWEVEPRNVAVIKALAGLEMRAGNRQAAVAILRSAVKDVPQAFELQVLLVDLLLDESKLTEAAAKIQELRDGGMPAMLPDYLQARLALLRDQWPQALALLEKVRADLGKIPEWASRVHALLGLCYRKLGDHEQELNAFRQAVAQEPAWTMARFGLGMALLGNGRLDEALAELQSLQNTPDAPAELWTALARVQVMRTLRLPDKQQNWVEVERALKDAADKVPKSPDLPWLRAEILTAQQKYAQARELLEKARDQEPKQLAFWTGLADLAIRQKDWAEASAVLAQAEKTTGDQPELRLARCRVLAAEGTSAARKQLEALAHNLDSFTAEARARVWRELAETWSRLGDFARAEALWQAVAKEQPRDLRVRFALFENALQSNQTEQARGYLVELRKLEGEPGTLGAFASAALLIHEARGHEQSLAEARKILEQLARRKKDWARVPLLQARIEELAGRPDQAIVRYQQAVELGERQPRHVGRLLRLLADFRRFLDAEQVLHKIEEHLPLAPELMRLSAEIALGNQNPKDALRRAPRAVRADSRDYRDFLWLGRVYHAAGADQPALDVLRKAADLAAHAPDPWIALAEQLTRMGRREAALTVVQEAAAKVNVRVALFTKARCYEAMGLLDKAEAAYQEALAKQPDDFILLAHAADFFRATDQAAKAEPYLTTLLKPSSAAPFEYVLRARRHLALIRAARGEAAAALQLVDENLRSRKDQPTDVRAKALVQAAQPSLRRQAIRVFEETSQRLPLSADEQYQLALLFDADGDQPRARDQVLTLLTAQPENPQFLVLTIRLLLKGEENDEAAKYLRKLEMLEPDSPRVRELKKLSPR